jgi:hypothetical protein
MANQCQTIVHRSLEMTKILVCFFEDLWAKGFRLVDMCELEDSMTDGEDDTNDETN